MTRRGTPPPAHVLPVVPARWLARVLPGPIPGESAATCDTCAMCESSATSRTAADLFFDSRTKCCTYHPDLANFLVGRILADETPELAAGRRAVESKLLGEAGASPLGIPPPDEYLQLFHESPDAFGRKVELVCPYYAADTGRCGIWRHRAGVCATWFCKHDRGAVGARFWNALGDLLTAIERGVAGWCATELGVEAGEPRAWGRWRDRKAEFYRECARLAEPLVWDDLVRICGPAITDREPGLVETYRRLQSRELPDALRRGACEVVSQGPDRARVRAYNPFDPIDLPAWVLEILDRFDGSQTPDALARIGRETGIWMPSTLAGVLCDFEILVPSSE